MGSQTNPLKTRARRSTLCSHFLIDTSDLLPGDLPDFLGMKRHLPLYATWPWQPSRCHRQPPLLLSTRVRASPEFQQHLFLEKVVSPNGAASAETGDIIFATRSAPEDEGLAVVHVVKHFLSPKSSFGNALSNVLPSNDITKAGKHPSLLVCNFFSSEHHRHVQKPSY